MSFYEIFIPGVVCGALSMAAAWMLVKAFLIQKDLRKGKD